MAGRRKAVVEIIEPPPPRVKPLVTLNQRSDGFRLDEAALARAEIVVESMRGDYLVWAKDEIRAIEKLYREVRASPVNRARMVRQIANLAHDVKGNGSSFGYDLMTAIGGSLSTFCRAIGDSRAEVGDARLAVVGVHIDAMKMVIDSRLDGDGGETGADMVAMLARVCELRR